MIFGMRLSTAQRRIIKRCVRACDPAAEVMLFGSRLHDHRKGGDIDLLIQSRKIGFMERLKLKLALMDALGPQKIDIAVDRGRPSAFVKLIRKQALPI
jgi:predicted nucleotidyltransferase